MNSHVTRQWFGDWANEYDATLGKVKRHHLMLDLAVRLSGVKAGNRVLDIGCGTGLLSLKFLKRADCRITAVDSSADMLRLFKGKIDALDLRSRVRCLRQDAAHLYFDRMYDNGKKHILNEGEYCVSFQQWKALCLEVGFRRVTVHPVPAFRWFKVRVAVK